ncbi:threonine/serine exporter family protein [Motilimonas cestriensis]|uniref:Threonine/serine exporter family protein n=1 Tax=Motilimonas cestriensis TaxID=2742685 RepID=A0ABS8WDH6_9GAMM|nr:threonine/serine exporter family protein [Motilimonas cestriensis]MCE2595806.1 threonine/serine exporter family protein [Motilimonas cestriensis]
MSQNSFDIKRRFIIKLGKALHQFGTPAYRLEAHLKSVAETMGLQGSFLVTPTSLTFVLWLPTDNPDDQPLESTHIVRVKPGEIDLGSLASTNELVQQVQTTDMNLTQALLRLKEIQNKPNPYHQTWVALAYAASGGAFAMLMSSNWPTTLWAALLSLVVYFLVVRAEYSRRVSDSLEPLVALCSAFFAMGIATFESQLNVSVAVLSAIIIFIPGLSLTMALSELASRELVSGTTRLMDAIMVLFKLYFGAVLGMALGALCWGQAIHPQPEVMPFWTKWLGVLLLSVGLAVVFKVRSKDIVWGVLAGVIAYAASFLGSYYLGEALGPFLGAFAVGVYGNLYARWTRSPASVVLLQGIVLLVPGSKTYISLNSLVLGESIVNVPNLGSQTFLIFMSLVAGLVFANVAIPPKSTL